MKLMRSLLESLSNHEKFGIILTVHGEEMIDEKALNEAYVYTNKQAFETAVKNDFIGFLEFVEDTSDGPLDISTLHSDPEMQAKAKAAKLHAPSIQDKINPLTYEQLKSHPMWSEFRKNVWVIDQF